MSTPTFEIIEGKHWSKVGAPENKGGRAIYKYKCHICNRIFKRHRNAHAHCLQCIMQHSKEKSQTTLDRLVMHDGIATIETDVQTTLDDDSYEEELSTIPTPLSHREKAIVELICDCNIPYTQLQSPSWNNFVKAFDEQYDLPASEEIRQIIIQYSQYICHHTLKDFKNTTVGLAVDGASFRQQHYYAMILVSSEKIRLLDICKVGNQRAETIAKELKKCYDICKKYNIKIAGVVSDNAASLKAAITGRHPLYLQTLLGEAVLRVACGAHTAQLVVGDVVKKNIYFKMFVTELLDMVKYIGAREEEFKILCPCKIPKYIATRWNTLCDVLEFVLDNQTKIDEFLANKIREEDEEFQQKHQKYCEKVCAGLKAKVPQPLTYPMQQSVPDYWKRYFVCLDSIRKFTTYVEGDLIMQYHLYVAYEKTLDSLLGIREEGDIEKFFCDLFIDRFSSTADILIAKLAYIFTAEGLAAYRASPMEDRDELTELLDTIASEALTEEEYQRTYIAACFDEYLDSISSPPRTASKYWKTLSKKTFSKSDLNDGNPISFAALAKIADLIIHLPATEAITERCFSALKRLVSDYNGSMHIDLFIAECKIKMAMRYKRRYN